MTAIQLFKRFLKDNDLYFYAFYGSRSKMNKERFKNLGRYHSNTPLIELFRSVFTYDPIFSGDSRSKQRQRYYALNKKWKYMVSHHVYLQTNIEVGDIMFTDNNRQYEVEGLLGRHILCKFIANREYLVGKQFYFFTGIKGKNMVNNLYYKDNKGRCYGKIDGEYNEIQLQ